MKGKTLPDASPYQSLQHENDPSLYRSLGEYNNEGYTHLNTGHQPVYGKLEREPELYETTNGSVQQPIYKELNHSQPEYRGVDHEQPEYKELNKRQPEYNDVETHQPEYGELFHPPEYGVLNVSPPEYREIDHRSAEQDEEPIYKELDDQLPDHVELDDQEPEYRELEPEDVDQATNYPENIYENNGNTANTEVPRSKPTSPTKPKRKPKPQPRTEIEELKKTTPNEPVNVRIYFSNPVVPAPIDNSADVNQLYAPVVKN